MDLGKRGGGREKESGWEKWPVLRPGKDCDFERRAYSPWVGLIARSRCLVTQKIVGHHVDNFQMPSWREERGIWECEVICPMSGWPLNNSIILRRRGHSG